MAGKNEANLADKKTPEIPKRGQYKERECPHCHAMTRNLGTHETTKVIQTIRKMIAPETSGAIITRRAVKKKRTRIIIEAKKTSRKQSIILI